MDGVRQGLQGLGLLAGHLSAPVAAWLLLGLPGLVVGAAAQAAVVLVGLRVSEAVAVRLLHARAVGEAERPGLHDAVARAARAARLAVPRVHVAPSRRPNAFTTTRPGLRRGPRDPGGLVVTQGLLDLLDGPGLDAVLAHECAHLARRDASRCAVAVPAVVGAAVVAPVLALAALAATTSAATVVAALALVVVGPALALHSHVRRARAAEAAADRRAAAALDDPVAVASALRRVAGQAARHPRPPRWRALVAATHLLLVDPAGRADDLVGVHADVAERVRPLEQQAFDAAGGPVLRVG